MVRAPCYDKMGLKKGEWSREEDEKLIAYIRRNGILNWREMPKPAGLSRSGKSCRLRWMNYLRPDIKHGNFSKKEEEIILKFQELLGNRWSAIAARLPGRTDNEIKNYWHTQLKKRVKNNDLAQLSNISAFASPSTDPIVAISEIEKASNFEATKKANQKRFSETNALLPIILESSKLKGSRDIPVLSTQLSTGNFPSISSTDPTFAINEIDTVGHNICSLETFGELQSSWVEPFSMENLYKLEDHSTLAGPAGLKSSSTSQMWIQQQMSPFDSLKTYEELQSLSFSVATTFEDFGGYISPTHQTWIQEQSTSFVSYKDTDFWGHLFV